MTEQRSDNEQRNFRRITFDARAHIHGSRGDWECGLIDVSLKGALAERPAQWQAKIDDDFRLDITLSPDVAITMQARVAHMDANRIGFCCDHIDVDSVTHLRRLLELNTDDPGLLDRELSALGTAND